MNEVKNINNDEIQKREIEMINDNENTKER